MCGGGGDVPDPPDMSELEDLFKASADWSFGNAQEMMDFFKDAYQDNKNVNDLFVDKALGEMDKNIADSDRARERKQGIFEPLEDQLAAEAQSYASPERLEYEAGKAEADVAQQFEAARKTAQDRLESYGVDPSQMRSGALDLGSRVAEAAAQASAGNQARDRAEQIGRDLRAQAIGVGQGYAGQIINSSQTGTASGTAGVNSGLATTSSAAQTMGTPQQWQGVGNNAVSAWGNTLNQGFANQMDAYNAQNAQSSGWGQLLGTVAGTALSFLAEGGAIPDDGGGYLPPEMSPSGGAVTDDIPAYIDGGGAPQEARLNAGEFVLPKDVVSWLGEKGIQQLILKSRKEMQGGNGERPAQPEMVPPDAAAGAIPA